MATAKKNAAAAKPAASKPAVAKRAVEKRAVEKRAVEKRMVEKPARAPRRKKVAAPVVVEAVAVDDVAASVPALAAEPELAVVTEAVEEPQATAVAKKGRTLRYLLPTNMEIAALGAVHKDLVALEASNDGPFVLDGANLSVIDTAGLQLLISFVSAVQASGKKVSWDNYSVQAYQLANELGVVEQLGD